MYLYNISEDLFLPLQLKFNFKKKLQMHHQKSGVVNIYLIRLLENTAN